MLGSGGSSTTAPDSALALRLLRRARDEIRRRPSPQAPAGTSQAVAETTSGASKRSGSSRNPFTPLPEAKAKSASSSSSSAKSASSSPSGGSSSSSGSGKSTPSSGGTTPTPLKPIAPAKKIYIHFHVTAQFGVVPTPVAGAPAQPAQLKTYADMPLNEPLPATEPQLVYVGVEVSNGKDAAFALTGEAILHGAATCKPSPTQCQAIVLAPGQSETLEVVGSTGQTTTYELKLISVDQDRERLRLDRARPRAPAHIPPAPAATRRRVVRWCSGRDCHGLYRRYATTEQGLQRSGK